MTIALAAAAIPVSIHTLTPSTYVMLAILGTVGVALIKAWPTLTAQNIAAKAAVRGEARADLTDCQMRMDALEIRLTASEERSHQFEVKLVGTLAAYRILDADVETHRPDSPALVQARRVLRDVFEVSPSTPADMSAMVARVI